MKKTVYAIAFYIAFAGAAQAQSAIKETRDDVADLTVINNELLVYTKKEPEGQFLYAEKKGATGTAQKLAELNAGAVNTVIGSNPATGEVYVYHKKSRKDEVIAFYTYSNGNFTKTGERRFPKLRNNSNNLGLSLSESKDILLISAELGKTKGYDDIYLSKWDGNSWTKPKNLGKSVNTRQPEFAPSLANDSLFFSRKDGDAAYIYAVPFKEGQEISQEPAKLAGSINQENAFNAYYKKQGDREVWITSKNGGIFTAFTRGGEVEELAPEVDIEVPEETSKPETVAVKEEVIAEPKAAGLTLQYALNQLYIGSAEEKELAKYLKSLPNGTTIQVKGYSDAKGSEAAKASVSKRRAQLLHYYIKHNFAQKSFSVSTDQEVLSGEGATYRKAEISVL